MKIRAGIEYDSAKKDVINNKPIRPQIAIAILSSKVTGFSTLNISLGFATNL
jgi:hypothetical protein